MAIANFNGNQYQVDWDWVVTSQNIAANTSTVYGRLYVRKIGGSGYWAAAAPAYQIVGFGSTINGTWGPYDFRGTSQYTLWQGSRTFTHAADGTLNISATASAQMYSGGGALITSPSVTAAASAPTIARASRASFSFVGGAATTSMAAGTQYTIHTNRASTGFTHNMIVSFANGAVYSTIATGVGASFNWTPPLSMLAEIPDALSGAGFIRLSTYSGSTLIGTIDTVFTLTAPAAAVPSISSMTVSDTNTTVSSQVGAYVAGLSRLKVIVNASGYQGSTIEDKPFSIGSTVEDSGGSIALNSSGTITYTGKAIDSRGRSATSSGTVAVLPYVAPKINSALARRATSAGALLDTGAYIRVDLNAAVQSLTNSTQRNAMTITIKTAPVGSNTYTTRNTITPGLTYATNVLVGGGGIYPETTAYKVRNEVKDKFLTSATEITVPTSSVLMHWDAAGVGVGKFRSQGKLDVAGDIYQSGNVVLDAAARATAAEVNAGSGSKVVTVAGLWQMLANQTRRGLVRAATQAEVNTGTNSTDLHVTPATLRNSKNLAFASASGRVGTSSSTDVTVTFPSGRFSVAPTVTTGAHNHANVCVAYISAVTSTSFKLSMFTLAGARVPVGSVDWQAMQMTSTAAAG